MHQINSHIKELLSLYDCVILPGLGGFVSAEVSACFDAKKNRFIAPSKEVSFNKNLKHNDGLLCQSVMKSENVDFKTAQIKVDAWVDEIRRHLSSGNYVLQGIGDLYLNENGSVAFKPAKGEQVSRGAFGLSSFYFPQLEEKKIDAALPQMAKQTMHAGSVSRWLAAASIFIMLLLFSRPTAYNDIQNASMGMNLDTIIEDVAQQPQSKTVETQVPVNEESLGKEILEETATDIVPSNVKLVSKPASKKEYHIIIASLSDRSQADLFTLNYCLGTFNEYQVLENGKRHRVSVKVFHSKEAALPYLKEVRASHPFFKDAWILTLNN